MQRVVAPSRMSAAPMRSAGEPAMLIRIICVCGALLAATGCARPRPASLDVLSARVGVAGPDRAQRAMLDGLDALATGDLAAAGRAFALGLEADPRHPHLNFLAAHVYDLRAAAGEPRVVEQAEVGYRLALRFDPNHWLAAYHLGRLYARQEKLQRARDAFARAVANHPGHAPSHYGLAVASYRLGDARTAAAALEGLPAKIDSPTVARARAIVYAALGDPQSAGSALARYGEVAPDWAVTQTRARVSAWNSVYAQGPAAATPGSLMDASDDSSDTSDDSSDASEDARETPEGHRDVRAENRDGPAPPRDAGMALLDAIIIEQSYSDASAHGINLLSALQVQFGGTLIDATRSRTIDGQTGATTAAGQETRSSLSIGLPAVTYALDIANAQNTQVEVVARPSVMIYDGKEAEVFLGNEVTYVTGGLDGGDSFSKEVGIRLKATPRFLPDGRIELSVATEVSSLGGVATPGTLQQAVGTRKSTTRVTARVAPGQTLAIAAGSASRESRDRQGVPILRDIPVVQYLFSRSESSRVRTSTLVLLTPRPVPTVDADGRPRSLAGGRSDPESEALAALRERHRDWFAPTSNTLAVMHDLHDARVRTEFRRGDLQFAGMDALEAPPRGPAPRHRQLADDLLEFLYF